VPEADAPAKGQGSADQQRARVSGGLGGADVVAEDAEDEIVVQGIENQWCDMPFR